MLRLVMALASLCLILAALGQTKVESKYKVSTGTFCDGHYYVDLGLPSGTKWATCNVGASSPTDEGDYFSWGETRPGIYFDESHYKWTYTDSKGVKCESKYNCADGIKTLEPEDDAATANWGRRWRMPTWEEWSELESNCTWTWTWVEVDKSCGYKVVSKINGNSIFLIFAGLWEDGHLHTPVQQGNYWTSSRNGRGGTPVSIDFDWMYIFYSCPYRYKGLSVRPVLAEEN